jgi:hypothetical protein
MSTPQFDLLKTKVRDWSNRRDVATVPESIIEDCLQYGIDDVYRDLRIPQLEYTVQFTVTEANRPTGTNYCQFDVPEDLIEFIYVRRVDPTAETASIMLNQVNDVRSFLDPYAEQYNWNRYVWKDFTFLTRPRMEVGDVVELHYYRRLGQLDALYSVIPANWSADYADALQPLLDLVVSGGTNMYKGGTGETLAIFATEAEASTYCITNGGSVETVMFTGKEAWNWLRDAHERVCIYSALRHIGSYLNDDAMEKRYMDHTTKIITDMNREEKYRRAKGGNVQINVNTGGLI